MSDLPSTFLPAPPRVRRPVPRSMRDADGTRAQNGMVRAGGIVEVGDAWKA
ncbi:hypothetical protein [Microbacterium sp. NPDC087591]|uniref:hypothetical protein n=1 Tax=Microbacterium sp. NPDC087591 TaxID=3364192 RepID=UPI003800D270